MSRLTAAHFSVHSTHCLLNLSSFCLSSSETHLRVSIASSHSYDLGVRVALTPSLPGSSYLAITQSFPPRGCSMSGILEPACLLAACLSGPADWLSSTTDAPGQWSRSSYGTDLMENCADESAVGEQG